MVKLSQSTTSISHSTSNEGKMSSQVCLHGDKAGQEKNVSFGRKIINALWSTRQTRDTSENQSLLIKTTLKELITYLVYLIILSIITFGMTNSINYYYTNVMMNLFLQQTVDGKDGLNFAGIGGMQDFWDVYNGPILNGLYWEKWYNGDNASQPNFIFFENKILGVPRLRQLRVKKNSCKVYPLFHNTIEDCFDDYGYFAEDQSQYSVYNIQTINGSSQPNTAFTYQSASVVNAPIISGTVSTYGSGGYIQNLGLSKADTGSIFQFLIDNVWLDRGTRAVFLDFTIYNANINLFCQIRLITEFPSIGGSMSSWSFRSVKLLRYVSPMDFFVLTCEIFFVLFILYYSIEEAIEIKTVGLKYFKEVWNCLDVIILLICYVCVIFNVYRSVKVSQILDSLLVNSNQYPDFETLSYLQVMFNSAIAITAFLSWIKIFKYVSFNKTMNQLSSTLGKCAKDLAGFSVMFSIVFFAFAQLGYLLFGSLDPDYASFMTTMFTLGRMILGDFDFPTLQAASPTMGPIYFIVYIFIIFFVLLNMFLAIINDTYSEVKSDVELSKSEFELGDYFKSGYDKFLNKLNLKKDKIIEIQNILDQEQDVNQTMDFNKWRSELRNRGYNDTEIEAYFSKYDKDGDRNLTADEQKAMREDLKNQSKALDKEMDDMKHTAEEFEENEREAEKCEAERKANIVSHEEFRILTLRVDTMESSIGTIVNRIDGVLSKLDSIEKAKLKRREHMAEILDRLNEAQTTQNEFKRKQLQQLVREELEKMEEPLSNSPSVNFVSRAASPRTQTPLESVGKKQPWLQQ